MLRAGALGLDPYGLSFHVGSQQTRTDAYEVAIGRVAMLFTDLCESGVNLRMVNLGGGFPARYSAEVPEIDDFAHAIMGAMTRHFGNALPEMVIEPGRYRQTSSGSLQLGRTDGRIDDELTRLARLLAPIGDVRTTDNLAGVRWSKLALNSAITTLGAVAGQPLGGIVRHHYVRRLALEVFTELVEVARRRGIRLAHVSGTFSLETIALPRPNRTPPPTSVASILAHLFQHQIHHRGQAHAMLSSTRVKPPKKFQK